MIPQGPDLSVIGISQKKYSRRPYVYFIRFVAIFFPIKLFFPTSLPEWSVGHISVLLYKTDGFTLSLLYITEP